MAYSNEAQVNADIKNNDFRDCYIVFGEDRFLKKRIVEKRTVQISAKPVVFPNNGVRIRVTINVP